MTTRRAVLIAALSLLASVATARAACAGVLSAVGARLDGLTSPAAPSVEISSSLAQALAQELAESVAAVEVPRNSLQ